MMEEAQIETPKPSEQRFPFSPPRRRQLKSATCRTLVRILSYCSGESSQIITDSGSVESGEKDKKEEPEHVKLGVTDNMELGVQASCGATELDTRFNDASVSLDGMSGNTQMAIDNIEQMLNKEENEDGLNQINVKVNESSFGTGLEDMGLNCDQMLIDELDHIAKGNEDLVYENISTPSTNIQLDHSDSGINEVKMLNNQEERIVFQQNIISPSGNTSQNMCDTFDLPLDGTVAGQSSIQRADYDAKHSPTKTKLLDPVPVIEQKEREMENTVSPGGSDKCPSLNAEVGEIKEGEQQSHKASETIDVSLGKNAVTEASKYSDNHNHQNTSPEANAMMVEYETQILDEELKTSNCKSGAVYSGNHTIEDEDNEEGEIFYDCGDYGVDANSMNMVLQDGRVLEDKKTNHQQISRCIVDYRDIAANGNDSKSSCFLVDTDSKTSTGGVELRENDRNKMVNMRQDAEPQNKKRRGPPSKERKSKKKQKERKKRAEKNRQLGVKRLKLIPMSKPKTPKYCRHFLKGRCQEGDKCKFSHDTIPLTKSKPCCHFARNSCMKGNDCPFDHQLSKYPCSNFVSKGSCSRGSDCLFSHKILPKEETANALNVIKSELKPTTLLDNSKSKEKPISDGATQMNPNAFRYTKESHSHVYNQKNMKETVLKQPEVAPRGTSQNSLLVDSNELRHGSISGNDSADAKAVNVTHQSASVSVRNSNEMLQKTSPAVALKGVNFLSFGKVPSDNSNDKKLASLQPSKDGVRLSALDNPNMHRGSSTSNSIMMPNGSQPLVAREGINFLPFGKASMKDSGGKEKFSLPYGQDNGSDHSVKQTALDKPQSSSTRSSAERSPSNPFSSVQFSGKLASRINKDTPLSAQKALSSTLAFAAKCESSVNLKQSVGASAVNTETVSETRTNNGNAGGPQNDLGKATKFLELLSNSISSKMKQ